MARNSSVQESKPERRYSNKYVEFLYTWDTTRRLKKAVAGPPEGYQHPGSIHGQRVQRLGKGIPPPDNQEVEFRMHRRRPMPNMNNRSRADLLAPRPATADGCMHLYLEETRHRAVLGGSGRTHAASSLKGAGAVVAAEAAPQKPKRAKGTANPGQGLSEEMVQVLSFEPNQQQAPGQLSPRSLRSPRQQQQQQQRSLRKMVWSVAPVPKSAVAEVLRHRMSDSAANDLSPPKFEVQRPMTPTLQSCSAEERSTAFYSSLKSYARNKVVGDYGSMRTQSGLRTLAGYAR